jgi:cytosine/adenosine deaminase-related metal-dependent hydrolase
MHLLETKYQRQWADRSFPQGIVRYLDDIGLVNERVSFAHCIYLRPDEIDLIAARGATIVVNTSSNFIVSSGLAPLAEFIKRGCRVAMGLDGLAFDEDEDGLREMRLAYNVHKASGFDVGVSQAELMRFATTNGRFAVTGMTDEAIAPGAPADFLTLDWKALSAELIEPDVPPFELLLAKGVKQYITGLVVAGRPVMTEGQVSGVDLPALEAELLAMLRAKYPTTADMRTAMPELKSALRKHYTGPLYCA